MATTRPLMQLGIGDLEEIFDKQGKNPAALARLKYELSHRQVPRAVALLEKIRRAESLLDDLDSLKREPKLTGSTVQLKPRALGTASGSAALKKNPGMYSSGGLSSPPEQPDLLTGLQPLSTATPAKKAEATSHTTDTTPVKKLATTAEPEALPQLALEDACRILKVVAGAPWEKVEAARRMIVLKSSPLATKGVPSAQVQKLIAEAQKANDAATVMAARRSGRQ